MMLFYIIPFEKRFCSYLKLLSDWRLWRHRRVLVRTAGPTNTRVTRPAFVVPSACLL